jgi:hypothetical protein
MATATGFFETTGGNHLDTNIVRDHIDELLNLFSKKQDAALLYSEGIEAVSRKADMPKQSLAKVVMAIARERSRKTADEAEAILETIAAVAPAEQE